METIGAEPAEANSHSLRMHFRNVGNLCRVGVGLLFLLIPGGRNFLESAALAKTPPERSADPSAKSAAPPFCKQIELTGEVGAGQEWSATIGRGWVFRLVPITPSGKGYTGWDLVVDRVSQQGYPDALLLGTPPYESLNEREIGTTFGLRAQDAIAWGPRRFHFLASAADLAHGRELFRELMSSASGPARARNAGNPARAKAGSELLEMVAANEKLGFGEFKVLDAKLTAGTADPPIFARPWAAHLDRVPHTLVESGQAGSVATDRGELRWIRFAVVLQMPRWWETSPGTSVTKAKCTE